MESNDVEVESVFNAAQLTTLTSVRVQSPCVAGACGLARLELQAF